MVSPEFGVASHAANLSRLQRDIAPHREVKQRQRLGMEQSDEVDEHHVRHWDSFRRAESPRAPVEPSEHTRPTLPERLEHFCAEPEPFDTIPVRRAAV